MSTPGIDNLSRAQRRKLNRENRKASAAGNKTVESASAKTEEPQLRSANETPQYVAPQYVAPKPQTNAPAQLLSNEQIDANRQEYKRQAVQQAKQQGATLPITGTQSQANPTKVVVKKKTTKDVNPYIFTPEPYNAEDAEKRMSEDNWLKRLKKEYDDANEDARLKAEDSSRQAKGAAWGNLFSALGQLAGVGKNTYVAPDNKYLTNALSKADKAREFYDAIKESNRKNLLAAQNAWLEADRKSHANNQENMRKFYENLNNNIYKYAQNNSVETTEEYDDLARDKVALQKRNADIAERRAKAAEKGLELKEVAINQKSDKAKKDAEDKAFINYKDNDVMQNYNLNESEALRIANYLIKNKGYTMDKLGLTGDVITGVFTVQNRSQFKGQVLDFLDNADWANEPAVLAIMNNSDNYPFGTDEERYGDTGWAGAPKAD